MRKILNEVLPYAKILPHRFSLKLNHMASILPFSNALGNAPFHHKYHAQVNLSKHAPCRQQRVETKIITCINLDQKGEPHSHRQTQNGKIRRQEINVSVFFLLFFC